MPGNPARRPKAVVIRTRRKPKGQEKLFAAIALVTCLHQPSSNLSGNAANYGVSLAAAPAASPAGNNSPNSYTYTQQGYSPYTPPNPYTPQGYPATDSGGQSAPAQQSASSYGSPSGTTGTTTDASSGGSPSSIAGATTQASSTGSPSGSAGGSTGSTSSIAGATTQAISTASSAVSSSSLSDVPGVPQAFAACVAFRESTDLKNPAANGNAYGIIPASGYNVSGTSLAYQKQVFAELYQQYGTQPWAGDGCA